VANPLVAPSVRDTVLPHIDSLIDLAVNDLGITRLRYSLSSGFEDTIDHFTRLRNGLIDYDEYKRFRYFKINDNDDPFHADPDGFQMSALQDNLEQLILPFKAAVETNGEHFYLNMCYVDFSDQSPFHHTDNPEEYAEYLAYVWQWMYENTGFTPDGLEVILEPDNADVWNQNHIPDVLAATGDRLTSLGYDPEYIAPSVLNLRSIPLFINAIAANPKAMDYLDVIAYHRYSGNSDTLAQQKIVELAKQYGKKTAMLEYDSNGDVNELHYDLKYNQVVAWTKYALMYKSDVLFAYVYVDASDPAHPRYDLGKQTKYLRQYFKFIRPGAERMGAESDRPMIDPVAFENRDGQQVVVVKASEGDSIVIQGLKAGRYGIKYTLGNYDWRDVAPRKYNVDLPPQKISEGERIRLNMPEKGVVTIYGIEGQTTPTAAHLHKNTSVHPNPTTGTIYVKGPEDAVRYELFSLEGRTVDRGLLSGDEIRLGDVPSGMYILQILDSTGGVIFAHRILIRR